MKKNINVKLKNRCLLVSLGAKGLNPLIPNGKEIALVLEDKYENLKIISTDEHLNNKRFIRLLKYFLDIFKECLSTEKTILFVHMNTQFASILYLLNPKKYIKIFTWYSHVKITRSANFILNKSNNIATASPLVKKLFPKSKFTHCIKLPSINEIAEYKKKYFKPHKKRLVFVGRFSKVKRIDRFVELIDLSFKEGLIDEYKFMAIDHEIEVKEKILKELEELDIPRDLYINEKEKSIYQILDYGDILISLSKEIGINKVMIEASALGVPVLTTSKIYYEIFKDYKCLSLNEPYSTNDALNKLKLWKSIKENYQIKANNNAIKISQSFSVKALIASLIEST